MQHKTANFLYNQTADIMCLQQVYHVKQEAGLTFNHVRRPALFWCAPCAEWPGCQGRSRPQQQKPAAPVRTWQKTNTPWDDLKAKESSYIHMHLPLLIITILRHLVCLYSCTAVAQWTAEQTDGQTDRLSLLAPSCKTCSVTWYFSCVQQLCLEITCSNLFHYEHQRKVTKLLIQILILMQ